MLRRVDKCYMNIIYRNIKAMLVVEMCINRGSNYFHALSADLHKITSHYKSFLTSRPRSFHAHVVKSSFSGVTPMHFHTKLHFLGATPTCFPYKTLFSGFTATHFHINCIASRPRAFHTKLPFLVSTIWLSRLRILFWHHAHVFFRFVTLTVSRPRIFWKKLAM